MKAIFLLSFILFSQYLSAGELKGVFNNKLSLWSLKSKEINKAYKYNLKALAEDPGNLIYRFNLATQFAIQEDWVKAKKELEFINSQVMGQSDFKFYTLFNLAILSQKEQQVEQALKYYQKALTIKPDSKEVKTNIELLLKKQKGKGKGKGKGKNKNKDQKKDDKKGDKQKDKPDPSGQPEKKPKEQKKQKGQKLSKSAVRKIFEELKNQEQKIRAKEFGKKPKSKPKGKDW